MMKNAVRRLLNVCVVAGVMAIPSTSFATNGMFLIGQGAKSRAMGGVAIAFPQDPTAGAVNPASVGFMDSGIVIGADYFLPRAEAELGGNEEGSAAKTFLIPAMAGVYKFNRKMTIGFSAVPVGGGGSRYNFNLYNAANNANTAGRTLGVNLMVMQANPTLAYRVNKNNRIGASLVIGIQTFRAFGLDFFSNFTSSGLFTDKLSNNGNDYGYGVGVRLGWMGKFFKERLALGASYSSRVYNTKFDKYAELFAEQGGFDTPENFGVGMALKLTKKLTIGADVTHTLYSNVNSIGNDSANKSSGATGAFPTSQTVNGLGEDQGLGFGWSDQTVYKVGLAYDYNSKWTFRTGWNYGDSPIDETNGEVLFSIVAPATVRHHFTVGSSYRPSKNSEWSFSYVHAFKYEQSGPTFIGNTGTIRMHQNSFGMSFSYKL